MFHQFNHVNATGSLNNGTSVMMKIKYTDSYMIYLKKKTPNLTSRLQEIQRIEQQKLFQKNTLRQQCGIL